MISMTLPPNRRKLAIFTVKSEHMLYSMTGFGKAVADIRTKRVSVELRSINSKQFDLSVRIPGIYKEKETELRLWLAAQLERGKVDLNLSVENVNGPTGLTFDKELAARYLGVLKEFAEEQALPVNDYLSVITRFPEVIRANSETPDEEEWSLIMKAIEEAVQQLHAFRKQEGGVLEKDFRLRIDNILAGLAAVEPFEKQRVATIKERLHKNLTDFLEGEEMDKNRLEQELFFYLEKLDITEEKVRLKKHCDYFLETLNEAGFHGKKLNFITQEIGREINTLGSKANDAEIQRKVVGMKDELEKIKEQLLNIL